MTDGIIRINVSNKEYEDMIETRRYKQYVKQGDEFWCPQCIGRHTFYSVKHKRTFCINCLISTWRK